jgi:citrate lyase subunit beta/citryl-CoA lyase
MHTSDQILAIRSLLFVPASDAHKLEKARSSGADAIIIDLEDAVAPEELPRARSLVSASVVATPSPAVFVRINHPSSGLSLDDLGAAVHPGLTGIVVPKVESPIDIEYVAAELTRLETERGLPVGSTVILPLIESGLGVHHGFAIASASTRVVGLAFSSGEEGDFMADIDGRWTPDGQAMGYARGKLVSDTRAAGLNWPVDGVFMNFSDDAALEVESRNARIHGYQAKMAIHPRQLDVIHTVFTPSVEEVERSLRLVEVYEAGLVAGLGAVGLDGAMVDKANVASARKVLARAARRNAHDSGNH